MRRPITDAEIQSWQAQRLEGKTIKEIADRFNRSTSSVGQLTLPVVAEYVLYHTDGSVLAYGTRKEIAKQLNVTENALSYYNKKSTIQQYGERLILTGYRIKSDTDG